MLKLALVLIALGTSRHFRQIVPLVRKEEFAGDYMIGRGCGPRDAISAGLALKLLAHGWPHTSFNELAQRRKSDHHKGDSPRCCLIERIRSKRCHSIAGWS